MSSDLIVPAVAATSIGNTAAKPKPAAVEPRPLADSAPTPPLTMNPVLRLDEGLGLVVIEFHNDSGVITTSIPSQRQLAAYRRWNDTRFGPAPPGLTDAEARTPPHVASHTPTASIQNETEPAKIRQTGNS
jgi:hypothetical protein